MAVSRINYRQEAEMYSGWVSINDEIVAAEDAKISVFDRGFLFGDSVFETMRLYGSKPFALSEHLKRLRASGGKIGFDIPWGQEALGLTCSRLSRAAKLDSALIRLIATRGQGAFGVELDELLDPQLVCILQPLPPLPDEMYQVGRSARLVGVRRNLVEAIDPQAKTGNYMNNLLAMREARQYGYDEPIMLDHRGRVAESSTANIFVLLDNCWCTPPLEVGILAGITRETIFKIGRLRGFQVEERVLWPDDLRCADEMFLCSSVREILPVVSVDDRPVGRAKVGTHTQALLQWYRDFAQEQACWDWD
ncbi:MAG TPA: aminotransferase [Flavobacteriales bacterium]|nr:aminotransferase [Flavobacteriales bacterium]